MAESVITPSVFAFQQVKVRTIVEGSQIWFVVRDVCNALGLKWHGKVLCGVPDVWQGMRSHLTPSGKQRVRVVSEPAVYKLAFRSNKPEADAFTNWVASEVLPAIRKTGKFEASPAQPALPPPALTVEEKWHTAYTAYDRWWDDGKPARDTLHDLTRELAKKLSTAHGPTNSRRLAVKILEELLYGQFQSGYVIGHAMVAADVALR